MMIFNLICFLYMNKLRIGKDVLSSIDLFINKRLQTCWVKKERLITLKMKRRREKKLLQLYNLNLSEKDFKHEKKFIMSSSRVLIYCYTKKARRWERMKVCYFKPPSISIDHRSASNCSSIVKMRRWSDLLYAHTNDNVALEISIPVLRV